MDAYQIARLVTFILGYAIVFFSLIPLIRSDYWFVRIFDYPRSQKFLINSVVIIASLFLIDYNQTHDILFLTALILNECYLLSLIWNYTPLAKNQMKKNSKASADTVKRLIANVLQDNRNTSLCTNTIKETKPDIILLVETDDWWCKEIEACIKDEYPYRVLQPQSDTYGMILFSSLEIVKSEIRFLVEPDIPSITAEIKTKDGQIFRLYCLHPKPPVPGESSDSTERDAEILIIGKEAKKSRKPVIVAGDLNDVAWSYTTNLFLKVSELLDPRIGRGFFSTYNAKYKFLRWPLDHVFCSSHFYLTALRRLPFIGSDHFPIYLEVSLMPQEISANVEEKKEADAKDHALAEEKIDAAK